MWNSRSWMVRYASLVTLCMAAMTVAGCSGEGTKGRPKVSPVSGTVKYNGNPVVGASISFAAEGSPRFATGTTDAQGKYSLTTFDTNDGAVVGKHTVTITQTGSGAGVKKPEQMTPSDMIALGPQANVSQSQLPAKYADPKTSDLTRTVVEGETNEFNFDLTD